MLKKTAIALLAGLGVLGWVNESYASALDRAVIPVNTIVTANRSSGAQFSPAEAEKIIAPRSQLVIKALKDSDMKTLGTLVHPVKGVRFSPDATILPTADLIFKGEQLAPLIQKDTVFEWGAYDGTGFPMKLTLKEYLNQFVYDRDYANAEKIAYNQFIASSSSTNNLREVYPDAIFSEYYFSGSESNDITGMLFSSLRLIFEFYKDEWYLVGISHVHWTI
ncbi:hypothetical protein [Paenibacillus sp. MMS20-IR301]|uniref:hypothetical protein n=1 Tax=Paenibacillus sp. MMS20-IR301 TaxID=2895946 RepID=UPI0028E27144|nr:hypothetical protein [Paenibacillus sp. MMS20-IR301]WNS44290.1 hypothetical protein LOS79_03185 [Paenibacillus sp. MMS20-IR301]